MDSDAEPRAENVTGPLQAIVRKLAEVEMELSAQLRPRSPDDSLHALSRGGSEGQFARQLIKERRKREQYFDAELFGEPAWDILLDLFAAEQEGRNVGVSSLCLAAAVPPTTALRWIKSMTTRGLLVRQADPKDGRRIFVALSPAAKARMLAFLRAAMASGSRP
jgi:DNA-binding MarR family transcriptional regulator